MGGGGGWEGGNRNTVRLDVLSLLCRHRGLRQFEPESHDLRGDSVARPSLRAARMSETGGLPGVQKGGYGSDLRWCTGFDHGAPASSDCAVPQCFTEKRARF